MKHYDLLLFGGANHVVEAKQFSLGADHDALSLAFALLPSYSAVEVWAGARMVARVPHWSTSSRSRPVIQVACDAAVSVARMQKDPRMDAASSRVVPLEAA